MSKKDTKPKVSSGSPQTMLSSVVSSLFVIIACSFGIWIVNSLLMAEISTLRDELGNTSKRLVKAESQLSNVPLLQSKLDRALTNLNSAQQELQRLRNEVSKPSKTIEWNQLPENLTTDFQQLHSYVRSFGDVKSRIASLDNSLNIMADKYLNVGMQVTGLESSVSDLEKCFHCPCDFDRIVDSCYFIQRNKLKIDHAGAAKICQSKNASLVSIDSLGEFHSIRNFLVQIFESRLYEVEHGWLTGGRRFDGALKWVSTGQPLNDAAIVWGANEPSNEECVTFFPLLGRNMNLADISCDAINRQFICEL